LEQIDIKVVAFTLEAIWLKPLNGYIQQGKTHLLYNLGDDTHEVYFKKHGYH